MTLGGRHDQHICEEVKIRRALFAALGVLCVVLGISGVFVPGVPTTEFILAASYLFARSSPALAGRLAPASAGCGPPLRRFRESREACH